MEALHFFHRWTAFPFHVIDDGGRQYSARDPENVGSLNIGTSLYFRSKRPVGL